MNERKQGQQIELPRCECLRCGWTWMPRVPSPATCPSCKDRKWDVPRHTSATDRRENGKQENGEQESGE